MDEYLALTRRMWHQLEPIHAVLYYAPQASEEAAALGYETATRWPAYFAWRSAPLGAAGPDLVAAACVFGSGLLPAQSTLGIGTVAPPQW